MERGWPQRGAQGLAEQERLEGRHAGQRRPADRPGERHVDAALRDLREGHHRQSPLVEVGEEPAARAPQPDALPARAGEGRIDRHRRAAGTGLGAVPVTGPLHVEAGGRAGPLRAARARRMRGRAPGCRRTPGQADPRGVDPLPPEVRPRIRRRDRRGHRPGAGPARDGRAEAAVHVRADRLAGRAHARRAGGFRTAPRTTDGSSSTIPAARSTARTSTSSPAPTRCASS
jgi:hypothetical protein